MITTFKAKLKNQNEVDFCNDIIELVKSTKTPYTHLTFVRKSKSYGSTGVARLHTYTYKDSNKVEFWINISDKIYNSSIGDLEYIKEYLSNPEIQNIKSFEARKDNVKLVQIKRYSQNTIKTLQDLGVTFTKNDNAISFDPIDLNLVNLSLKLKTISVSNGKLNLKEVL